MTRRRLPGTRWRFLAHHAPTRRGGMYGPPIDMRSDDADPSVFDELVVDRAIHIEAMSTAQWWMNVGGVTLHVDVDRDGRPRRVVVHGPGDYDDPVPGCEYRLTWSRADGGAA